jgi:opacity protein-like surface antigen
MVKNTISLILFGMKAKIIILCFLLATICTLSFAQKDTLNLRDKGFDFFIGGGIFFGSKQNAAYYSGKPDNECPLSYIFNNKYWYDEINQKVKDNNHYVSDSVYLKDYPGNVSYKVSMSISLGAKYKFDKNWGLSLSYTFSRLTASAPFFLYFNAPPNNDRYNYVEEKLVAKEDRSMIDLSVSCLFHPHKILKPFIEMGVQLNYVKVKSFNAYIEGTPFNLLDIYGGANYVPGVQLIENKPLYGGVGYGFVAAVGLKMAFNKYISLDPIFYLIASSIHLPGYTDMALNYGVQIRFVMSDVVFGKWGRQ